MHLYPLFVVERNRSTAPSADPVAVFTTQDAAVRFRDRQRIPDPDVRELPTSVLPWPIEHGHIHMEPMQPRAVVTNSAGRLRLMVDPFVEMTARGLVLYHVETNADGVVTKVEPAFQSTRCTHDQVPSLADDVVRKHGGRYLHLFAEHDEALRWRLQELGLRMHH